MNTVYGTIHTGERLHSLTPSAASEVILAIRGPGPRVFYLLLALLAATPALADSVVMYGVNDNGLIVGQDFTSAGTYLAFLYSQSTGMYTFLNPPGATNAIAVGINDSNQIVGAFGNSAGNFGYLYSGGTYTTISVPGAYQSFPSQFYSGTGTVASGINDNGVVVGSWDPSATAANEGYTYNSNTGQFTNTSISDGGAYTLPYGINDSGEISGNVDTFPSGQRVITGFIDNGGVFTSISYPGASSTIVQGINDSGAVVGWYTLGGVTTGFIYINGAFTSIMYPGSSATELTGISNNGEIVGFYSCSSGTCPLSDPSFYATPKQGGGYSFNTIPDPAPDPGTAVLFGAGLLLLAIKAERGLSNRRQPPTFN